MHILSEQTDKQMFVHREEQMKEIENTLGEREHFSVPCTFVYGQKSTGKTSLVTHILETQEVTKFLIIFKISFFLMTSLY